jgi:hypothetical protein
MSGELGAPPNDNLRISIVSRVSRNVVSAVKPSSERSPIGRKPAAAEQEPAVIHVCDWRGHCNRVANPGAPSP